MKRHQLAIDEGMKCGIPKTTLERVWEKMMAMDPVRSECGEDEVPPENEKYERAMFRAEIQGVKDRMAARN